MSPLLPPSRMRWCSAWSRSFLLGPDGCQRPGFMATDNGPAGAPPGQGLRSSGLIGQGRTGTKKDQLRSKCPRFEGNADMPTRSRRPAPALRGTEVSPWPEFPTGLYGGGAGRACMAEPKYRQIADARSSRMFTTRTGSSCWMREKGCGRSRSRGGSFKIK